MLSVLGLFSYLIIENSIYNPPGQYELCNFNMLQDVPGEHKQSNLSISFLSDIIHWNVPPTSDNRYWIYLFKFGQIKKDLLVLSDPIIGGKYNVQLITNCSPIVIENSTINNDKSYIYLSLKYLLILILKNFPVEVSVTLSNNIWDIFESN